jgi:hypothetical protein
MPKVFFSIYFLIYLIYILSRDSSGGMENKLLAGRPRNRRSIPFGAGDFSLILSFQTDFGAHPASYPMVMGGSFPRGKATGV